MKISPFDHRFYLDAFIKTAQYLAGLSAHEDIWGHLGEVMAKFYDADLIGFAGRRADGKIEFHHFTLSDKISRDLLFLEDIRETVAEVLDAGFLACRSIAIGEPHAVVFLPIDISNETAAVMLVGHATLDPVPRELLNVYLAVAGLAGATITRSTSEMELKRRRADLEELVTQRTEQANLLELAHDAILVRDLNGRIVYWNSGAEETYHYPKERALGSLVHELLQTQFPGPQEAINARVFAEGRWDGELRHTRSDGTPIVVTSRWALQRDSDGKPKGVLEINHDITQRKRAEEALKAHMAKLEFLNRELQEFTFVASHDLQEPLRKIQTFGGMLSRLSRDSLGAQGQDYLDRMIKSAERMQKLILALINYSQIANQTNPFEPVSLSKVIQDALSDLEVAIQEADLRVEMEELPVLEADEVQMRQLFQNLIGNAIKYRRKHQNPRVRIYAAPKGDSCEIYVEDNCIGFDEQYANQIFKTFQRLHGRNSQYEGTGMGLAICRKIAERHGGSITARSTPDQGSTFIITLPVKRKK